MQIERRKYTRFSVRDKAFAVFQPEPVNLIPIIDIGLGGLGIGINGIDRGAERLNSSSSCEIMIDDCSFFMDNLGFKLLPKRESMLPDAASPFQNIYGLKFVDLTPNQQSQLKSFIRKHTTGGMTPKFIRKIIKHFRRFLDKKDYGAACRNISSQQPSL